MTLSDWIEDTRRSRQRHGNLAFKYAAEDLFHGLLSRGGFWFPRGEDFYKEPWDLLVVLDSCRLDVMREVAPGYDWIETVDSHLSCGAHSREFIHRTFMNGPTGIDRFRAWSRLVRDPDDLDVIRRYWSMKSGRCSRSGYVTWNVFAEVLDETSFHSIVRLGNQEWNSNILSPTVITDHTIDIMRRDPPERMVAHYMQPHTPFRDSDTQHHDGSVWERIQRGEKPRSEAWEEYKENLRWVLDDVERLLENVDADRVVVTSDHGNAMGEWGCWGHRPYVPLRAVREVPWIRTSATDERTSDPEIEEREMADDIEERLKHLGYA